MQRKISWTLLLLFGILGSLFTACKGIVDRSQLQWYIYVNASDYSIAIDQYYYVDPYSSDTILDTIRRQNAIASGDSLLQETDLMFGSTSNFIRHADSVRVVFDKAKLLVFLSDDVDVNSPEKKNGGLLNPWNYQHSRKGDILVDKYIFTNAHYLEAEDCNGNCE